MLELNHNEFSDGHNEKFPFKIGFEFGFAWVSSTNPAIFYKQIPLPMILLLSSQYCYKIGFIESNTQIYWSSHELREILGETVRRAQYFSNSWRDQ